jgi:general stress protein 26
MPAVVDPGPRGRKIGIPEQEEYGLLEGDPVLPPEWDEVDERLRTAREFWLVALRAGGEPHTVAIWGLWDGAAIWFVMSPMTWTARHLAHDPRASVHLPDPRQVVILDGIVDRPEPDAVSAEIVDRYETTYGWHQDPADPQMPYLAFRAAAVRAWRSADIRGTAMRWTLPTR